VTSAAPGAADDVVDRARGLLVPVQVAIDLDAADLDIAELVEGEVAPLGVLVVLLEHCVPEEQAVFRAVLGYVPVRTEYEQVLIDGLVQQRCVVGFVETRDAAQVLV
jgi:hypothetical protein